LRVAKSQVVVGAKLVFALLAGVHVLPTERISAKSAMVGENGTTKARRHEGRKANDERRINFTAKGAKGAEI
jgi:hypothetical protein